MTEVEIPFNDWSTNRLIDGVKTATTRTKRYGEVGDTFTVDHTHGTLEYELTHIVQVPLSFVAYYWYEEEGAQSVEEFKDVWREIHHNRGYEAEWSVWLHCFREVGRNDN